MEQKFAFDLSVDSFIRIEVRNMQRRLDRASLLDNLGPGFGLGSFLSTFIIGSSSSCVCPLVQLWDHDVITSDNFLGHADIAIGSISQDSDTPLQAMLTLSPEASKTLALAGDLEVTVTLPVVTLLWSGECCLIGVLEQLE